MINIHFRDLICAILPSAVGAILGFFKVEGYARGYNSYKMAYLMINQ